MSHEDLRSRLEQFQAPSHDSDEPQRDRKSVRDMIMRFEKTAVSFTTPSSSSESLARHRDSSLGSLTSIVNPLQSQFHCLYPANKSQDRNSTVSVNSVLSNASEISNESSSSSGFVSDRNRADYPVVLRPAPPPPKPFHDNSSGGKSPPAGDKTSPRERRYSFVTPNTSPVLLRRVRQPPVIRRKSLAGNQSQNHGADSLWSYGVRQSDLEKLLRLKQSEVSDNEDEVNSRQVSAPTAPISDSDSSTDDSSSDNSDQEGDNCLEHDDTKVETMSTDRSTDTLINEDDASNVEDNSSITSEVSGAQSNYDNISIKSISSFDMVPYQKYDSITVSSDEFGSEVCPTPDTEFLTVSAVNEWCVTNSAEPVLTIETKKEKYRRRMTERVNELIHTETIYVDRLRHVVEDYIPETIADDVPASLKVLKTDIFSNIEKIHRFHKEEFLPSLKECENDLRKLGQCFRKYEHKFNMYVMYSRSNKRATRLVFENKPFFQEIQMQLGDRLDLSSYLLEPVQRIPRYKLFMDDLVKTYNNYENERCESDSRISKLSVDSDETGGSNGEPESDETPLESLKQAKTMIECVLTAIDGIMALENIRDCPPHINLLNQGRLLRQSEFYAMDSARRRKMLIRVFLFDKILLITEVYRKQLTVELFLYKDYIPVDDLGMTAKEHDQRKFCIWYKKHNIKSYKLETSDPEVRKAWVDEISSLLWVQALEKKELLLKQQRRKKSISAVSLTSDDSNEADKYNSLRGVPGEVRRSVENVIRRTTWYCE